MKRKEFIHLSAFAAAAVSFPLLHACNSYTTDEIISKPEFISRLFDEKTIKDTGKAYLQKAPAENSEDKLLTLLTGNSSIADSKDEKAIHNYLGQKIKQDFETGKTVMVKGWVLAVTEARQCALFSLVNGQ